VARAGLSLAGLSLAGLSLAGLSLAGLSAVFLGISLAWAVGAALLDQVSIISASLADLLAEEGALEGSSSSIPVAGVNGSVEGVELGDTVVQVVDDVNQSLFDIAAELVPVAVGLLGNNDGGLDVDVEQLNNLFIVKGRLARDDGFVVGTDRLELG